MTSLRERILANTVAKVEQENIYRPGPGERGERPAYVDFWADVAVSLDQTTGTRQDGTTWTQENVILQFTNMQVIEVYRGRDPFTADSDTYKLGFSESNVSQYMRMAKTIAKTLKRKNVTVFDINGKRVHFKEIAVPAPWDAKTGDVKRDQNGYPLKPTFFWSVEEVQDVGAGPTTQNEPPASFTDFTDSQNLELARTASGLTRGEFTRQVATTPVYTSLNDRQKSFVILKWLSEAQAAGILSETQASDGAGNTQTVFLAPASVF